MSAQTRQPAGAPVGGQFAATRRAETRTTLDRATGRMCHVDHLAATTTDEPTQLRLAQSGETAQRELLQRNPHLTVAALTWMVDHWTFNPRFIPEFAAHPNMTDDLRTRIRPW